MENLEQVCKETKEKLDKIQKDIQTTYDENEIVRKFLELQNEKKNLTEQLNQITSQININNWLTCKHIWVTTKQSRDYGENRTYNYCSCIKCGLSYEVFDEYETIGKEVLNDDLKREMFEFLQEHIAARYKDLHSLYFCNLQEGQLIYQKIKAKNPELTDELILQLWEKEIDKKTSRTRKRK